MGHFVKVVPLALGAVGAVGRFLRRRNVSIRAAASKPPVAPVAKRKPHTVLFGNVVGENRGPNPMEPPIERVDDLFWLRDDLRKDPEVIAHLKAENAHTESHLAHVQPLVKRVYDEIISSIQETDDDLTFPWGSRYDYFVRTVKGKSYPIVCRVAKVIDASTAAKKPREEVVLDVNDVAKPLKYCDLGSFRLSPSHDVLAYSVDPSGYETYEIRFKDLRSGKHLPDVIAGTAGSVSWGCGNTEVYYSTQDDAHRPNKVWRHTLGTPQSADECVLTEDDELFCAGFGRSSSGEFMLLESESTETNEVHTVSLATPGGAPTLMEPRRLGHRYYPEHRGAHWYVLTNRGGRINFDLVCAPLLSPQESGWTPLSSLAVAGTLADGPGEAFEWKQGRTLESITAFADFLVLEGREGGFSAVWVLQLAPKREDGVVGSDASPVAEQAFIATWHKTQWPSQNCCVYTAAASSSLGCVGANQIFDADHIFITYMSLTTPKTVYRYNMRTGDKVAVKTTPVHGFDADKYATCRIEVAVRDGTKVPVSIAYRKDLRVTDGPMLLSGYGSYGASNDPSFSRENIPLMDRGVVIAIAHVRGGGEMGRYWYETEGKYLKKMNTFNDFVDVAEHLVSEKWTCPEKLAITGRSAGGLLVGNAVNMKPGLFRCAVAAVPFVDMMVSMCDPSIPLTTGEWEEWGNPNEARYYDYMLSYGPMENIAPGPKPEVLVTSGLNDPRVAYWEGAKYAARLRDACEAGCNSRVLLKTDLTAGHFSATDRYHYFKERAYEHGFILDSLGLAGAEPTWSTAGGGAAKNPKP